jgi:hypothetical protein
MFLTRKLLDKWDPEQNLRNGEQPITILQIITLPLVIIGFFLTIPIDIVTFPWQLRNIYNSE